VSADVLVALLESVVLLDIVEVVTANNGGPGTGETGGGNKMAQK
jgi:hypothetical protein